jgi:hypothetical protein
MTDGSLGKFTFTMYVDDGSLEVIVPSLQMNKCSDELF